MPGFPQIPSQYAGKKIIGCAVPLEDAKADRRDQ